MKRKTSFQKNYNIMRLPKNYLIILIFALISGFGLNTVAGELVNPQLGATYVKLTNGTRTFALTLSARIDDKRVNIEDAPLMVYAMNESVKTLLGTLNTNRSGKAVLAVKPEISIPRDKEGYFTFEVEYAGNQTVNKASVSIHIQEASLDISYFEQDTSKNVQVKAFAVNDKGVTSALPGVPVEFYIKRVFCLYRFGGEKTDSTGSVTVQFPKNFHGDTTGKVILVAKILDNELYGTVETVKDYTGLKPLILEPKPKRGLGDTDAPLWMVYTLLVLLSGVWLHVLYVLSLVIRINIVGKKALKQLG